MHAASNNAWLLAWLALTVTFTSTGTFSPGVSATPILSHYQADLRDQQVLRPDDAKPLTPRTLKGRFLHITGMWEKKSMPKIPDQITARYGA
jgi:hypothetical protein